MSLAKKLNKIYNYGDYASWPDEERWELIEGVPYDMSPAPALKHQKLLAVIFGEIYNYLKGKKCEVFAAPFDVLLPSGKEKHEDITTVVQPDIVVVCDSKKLVKKGCVGAPDLVVEIISPSTALKDMREKLSLYEKHKVKEYWIVHTEDNLVQIYKLIKGQYGKPSTYSFEKPIPVSILKDVVIDLKEMIGYGEE